MGKIDIWGAASSGFSSRQKLKMDKGNDIQMPVDKRGLVAPNLRLYYYHAALITAVTVW